MKKLLLLFLFANSIYGQQTVEVRLVSAAVGAPFPASSNNPSGNITNDDGLNAILQAYNVSLSGYNYKSGHPYPGLEGRIFSIYANDPAQLALDLQAYAGVLQSAKVYDPNEFPDALYVRLQSNVQGSPTGFDGSVVVTNDAALNQIFQDFNVYYFTQMMPNAVTDEMQRTYSAVCDCDKALLGEALANYPEVIEYTEPIPAQYPLGTPQSTKQEFTVYPNPFLSSFSVRSGQMIKQHRLFDLSGKVIVTASSENELRSACVGLPAGLYFLRSEAENGTVFSVKLLKQ